jgi:hypothetical protein
MSPENIKTEVPAEGDLRPQLGGAVAVRTSVGAVSGCPFDAISGRPSIVAFKFGGPSHKRHRSSW